MDVSVLFHLSQLFIFFFAQAYIAIRSVCHALLLLAFRLAVLNIAVELASASRHEVKLVFDTLDARHVSNLPGRLIGDKAYDSDPLDEDLAKRGLEMIAPHRDNRKKPKTQDGRKLRRSKRRWKIERLFAHLQSFRQLVVRYEYHAGNFLGFVQLGCIKLLLRLF